MFNIHFPSLSELAIMLPAIVVGLTVHEFAHGWAAYMLGDNTARQAGRLTLNPLAHIDPVGLLLLFIAGFGWAKPVPVNPFHMYGDRRRGMLLVALAGPATNMLVALLSAVLLGLGLWRWPYIQAIMIQMININVVLAIFNLLPVPPLDGSKILAGLLPGRQEWLWQLEQYGTIVLLLLLFTGILGKVMQIIILPVLRLMINFAQFIASFIA
ncbi:site-2 protease family protein [Desulfurispora thermophila]|uniref:site-2 protease family protein n=1 Tax=Desulfurispora thermophila TaxID=265470 RepID=UPI00037CFEAA|nr:site-2 protease family protein [Desulfurispora thermophila]